jgi:hypothetical protein
MFLKARFGATDWHDWPITWTDQDGVVAYRMSPQIAAWWKGQA